MLRAQRAGVDQDRLAQGRDDQRGGPADHVKEVDVERLRLLGAGQAQADEQYECST